MSFFSKIIEVFTKEYRQEIEYKEQMRKNVDKFKLKNSQERLGLSERLKSQIDTNIESNFRIEVNPNPVRDEEREV